MAQCLLPSRLLPIVYYLLAFELGHRTQHIYHHGVIGNSALLRFRVEPDVVGGWLHLAADLAVYI